MRVGRSTDNAPDTLNSLALVIAQHVMYNSHAVRRTTCVGSRCVGEWGKGVVMMLVWQWCVESGLGGVGAGSFTRVVEIFGTLWLEVVSRISTVCWPACDGRAQLMGQILARREPGGSFVVSKLHAIRLAHSHPQVADFNMHCRSATALLRYLSSCVMQPSLCSN
jgi:hypothetical protein